MIKYLAINGFPGYMISNEGEVISCRSSRIGRTTNKWKVLKSGKDNHGRYIVCLSCNGKKYMKQVHRLVLETFVGQCPIGLECCHNDGNGLNNVVTNLRWDTRESNIADREKHGEGNKGEKHSMVKLSDSQVIEIRKLSKDGYTHKRLSTLYNVSYQNISRIVLRKIWKHIT